MKILIIVLLIALNVFLIILYGASSHKVDFTDFETIKFFLLIILNFLVAITILFDHRFSKTLSMAEGFIFQAELIYLLFITWKVSEPSFKAAFTILFGLIIFFVFRYQRILISKNGN